MSKPSTVLITGATGKLGYQLAIGFAAQGSKLIIPCRSPQLASELAMTCINVGAKDVILIHTDLTSQNAVKELQMELHARSLYPNILVNNARNINYLKVDDGLISRENWFGEFLLDVVVPYELTMGFANLADSTLKKVINIASIYGITAPNMALYEDPEKQSPINYGVVKAALIHLTKELAVRLAPKKVEVNSVSFGGVEGRADDIFQQSYARLCPSGRMLSDEEIFGPVRFLASSESNGMTGHNLVVDGGWTIW